MLITESQLNFNRVNNLDLLDNMNYLTEAESVYSPLFVPVVENTAIDAHLVRLEDMVAFAEANGIEDLGYALSLVCEASQVDPQTIVFSVQEDTIIADNEIATLTKAIINEGVQVVAVPVNPNLPGCLAADIALESLMTTGDASMLEALVNDDFETFFTEAKQISKSQQKRNSIADNLVKNAETDYNTSNTMADYAHKKNADIATNTQGKLETIWQKLKNGVGITRDWLAQILAWLHKRNALVQAEMVKVDPKKRSIFQKIKGFITKAIEVVTRKLHNFIQANRGYLSEYDLKTGQIKKNN